MQRRSVMTLAAGLALANGAQAQEAVLRGTATYRERMALPPGGVLVVTLQDISRADAPAETVASVRTPITGQVPIGFVLPYDPARILPHRRYSLRAVIELEGRVAFRTDTVTPLPQPGTGDSVALHLVRAAEAVPGLAGGDWVAEAIAGKGVLDKAKPSLAFAPDGPESGKVSGSGGCNRIAGSYTLAGESIGFGQMISTMMACAPPIGEQEARFMRALGQAKRWRITPEGRLELLDPAGVLLARLARQ